MQSWDEIVSMFRRVSSAEHCKPSAQSDRDRATPYSLRSDRPVRYRAIQMSRHPEPVYAAAREPPQALNAVVKRVSALSPIVSRLLGEKGYSCDGFDIFQSKLHRND